MPNWTGSWKGGRKYRDANGNEVFVIERKVGAKRRAIVLKKLTEAEALNQLAIFEADRENYATRKVQEFQVPVRVMIDEPRMKGYKRFLQAHGRTPAYIKAVEHYLNLLNEELPEDLRDVDLQGLKSIIGNSPSKKWATKSIKSFCSYLIEEGELEATHASRSLKSVTSKRSTQVKGYELPLIAKTYAGIKSLRSNQIKPQSDSAQSVRDVLRIATMTGAHFTEIKRMLSCELRTENCEAPIAAVVTFTHKSGDPHYQSLDAPTLAALLRLKKRGKLPTEGCITKYLKRAAGKDKPHILLGSLRHTLVTQGQKHATVHYPTASGVPLNVLSKIVGHKDTSTTERFYNFNFSPPLVQLELDLHHPDDP